MKPWAAASHNGGARKKDLFLLQYVQVQGFHTTSVVEPSEKKKLSSIWRQYLNRTGNNVSMHRLGKPRTASKIVAQKDTHCVTEQASVPLDECHMENSIIPTSCRQLAFLMDGWQFKTQLGARYTFFTLCISVKNIKIKSLKKPLLQMWRIGRCATDTKGQ